MKIRLAFVANSSSSSFLTLLTNLEKLSSNKLKAFILQNIEMPGWLQHHLQGIAMRILKERITKGEPNKLADGLFIHVVETSESWEGDLPDGWDIENDGEVAQWEDCAYEYSKGTVHEYNSVLDDYELGCIEESDHCWPQ